jgi:hypothetical protein
MKGYGKVALKERLEKGEVTKLKLWELFGHLLAVPPSAGELSSSVIAIAASRGEIRKSAR